MRRVGTRQSKQPPQSIEPLPQTHQYFPVVSAHYLGTRNGGSEIMHHRSEITGARVQLLKVLAALPGIALLTSKEAAIYINTTPEVLRVWRSQGKGPRYK